jgi:hypothetical protein
MTAPIRPRYANTAVIPEFVVREQLVLGLAELASSPEQLDEITSRFDALAQGSQDAWREQCRDALVDMLTPTSPNCVHIILGMALSDAELPVIGIVAAGDNEDATSATMGDTLDVQDEKIGDYVSNPGAFHIVRHRAKGVDHVASVEIGIWTTAPETSTILDEAVRYVLFRRKGHLTSAGVRDVQMAATAAMPSPDLAPRVGYVPLIRLTMQYQARLTQTTDGMPWKMTHTFGFTAT